MSTDVAELEAALQQRAEAVEGLLAARLARLEGGAPPRLLEGMRYALLGGGKRLRPVLCLAFAEAVGGAGARAGAPAQDAACALEYVHTYSLVHDDLPAMDDDDLRRGRPTTHKVYGEAMGILVGDALLTEAFVLVADGPEPVRARLVAELARGGGAAGMVGGQVLDIAEDRPAEEAYLTRLHRLKTGALIRAACRMGALAGGADADVLARADAYGDAVGLAFQIADDVLDVTADAATLGKPAGADAAAGRHTYPAVLGLEASRGLMRRKVEEAVAAVAPLEPAGGVLARLAAYAAERRG